jgi:hypothetical protein
MLWNMKFCLCIRKIPLLILYFLCNTRVCTWFFQLASCLTDFLAKTLSELFVFHACLKPQPSHCFLHPSATSCWVPLSSWAPFSQIPLAYVLPLMKECKFHAHIKEQATYNNFMYFNVHILRLETTRQEMQTYCLFSYCPSCRHISMTYDLWSVCKSVCSWDQIVCLIYRGSQQTWICGT